MPRILPPIAFRAGLALAALTVASAGARADTIDPALLKSSAGIMSELRKAGYKNVGVLKFQVEKGNNPPTFAAGRLPTYMATRLENVLILANDKTAPIGISRSASAAAARKDRTANYDTAEARKKLFDWAYPLAWGKDDVTVDAFLTGLVKLSPDYATTTVIIRAFDAKNPEPRDLASFTVPTTRYLLSDMDQTFMVGKRDLEGLVPINEKEPDKVAEAARQASVELDKKVFVMAVNSEKVQADPQNEPLDKLLDFKVFYGDKEVARGADNKLPTPPEGKKIHFTLRSKERLGIVLKVNGINTSGADREDRDANQCSMWVLQPGELYTIDGFYKENGEVSKFKVLGEDESAFFPLSDETKRGHIELSLFRQVVASEKVKIPDMKFTNYRQSAPRVETVDAAYTQVLAMQGPRDPRGLIVPSEMGGKVDINRVPFNNVLLAGHFTFTYFEKK